MENEKIVVVEERKGLVWKIVAGVVAAAAICAVAVVIIRKISKKKKAKAADDELLDDIDELELLDALAEDDEAFEAPAEEVIADAE